MGTTTQKPSWLLLAGILFAGAMIVTLIVGVVGDLTDNGDDVQRYPACISLLSENRPGTDPDAQCLDGGEVTTFREYMGR